MRALRTVTTNDLRHGFDAVTARVPDSWKPIIGPARLMQSEALKLESDVFLPPQMMDSLAIRPQVIRAELFVIGDLVVALRITEQLGRARERDADRVVERSFHEVLAVQVGPSMDIQPLLQLTELFDDELGLEFRPWRKYPAAFRDLKEEGRESPSLIAEDEIVACQLLSNRSIRKLTTSIKSSSGILLRDVAKQLDDKTDESTATELVEQICHGDLARRETVVICNKTGAQVARTASADVIRNLQPHDLRCPCGVPLIEERTEEAITITERGVRLLDGSHWFTLLLVDHLLALGVELEDILVEQVSGGDEMDCIAAIGSSVVLFELKDKQFSLNNAYSFGAKIGIIRPDVSVIVTTDRVGSDVRGHFEKARAAAVSSRRARYLSPREDYGVEPVYIEGIDNLQPGLDEIITQLTMQDAIEILDDVLGFASLNSRAMLENWHART